MSDALTPATNPQLLGHEAVERYLLESWQQERMPHALLFSGSKGVGKATMAYRLARFVLSGGSAGDALFAPDDLAVSMDSPVCHRMQSGAHGDFLVITPDTSGATPVIKIDAARQVNQFLKHTPSESPWRVVVIDSADELNANAANALLKVLEEPPAHAIIILISHNSGKLLPTLKSRCRKLSFRTPDFEGFKRIIALLDAKLSDEELQILYALTYGSPGQALQWHQQQAVALYEQLVQLFATYPTIDMPLLTKMVTAVNDKKKPENWMMWQQLWLLFVSRLILSMNGNAQPLAIEAACFERLAQRSRSNHWLEVAESSARWFAECNSLHLDRKQVVQTLVSQASAA